MGGCGCGRGCGCGCGEVLLLLLLLLPISPFVVELVLVVVVVVTAGLGYMPEMRFRMKLAGLLLDFAYSGWGGKIVSGFDKTLNYIYNMCIYIYIDHTIFISFPLCIN